MSRVPWRLHYCGAKMTSLAGHSYNGSLYCFSHRSSLPRLLCKHTQAHTPTRIHTHAHTTVLAVSSLGSVSVACYQSTLIRSFCVCVCGSGIPGQEDTDIYHGADISLWIKALDATCMKYYSREVTLEALLPLSETSQMRHGTSKPLVRLT